MASVDGASAGASPVCTANTWFGRTAIVFAEMQAGLVAGAPGAALPVEKLTAASRLMAESYGARG